MTDFVGTAGDDTYTGDSGNNSAVGGVGNDRLSGNAGNDTLEGDAGADTLSGGTGSDILYSDGPLGSYSVPYYNNTYITPQLDRGGEADVLAGGDGDDVISAGYGDSVDGGSGTDTLFISFQGAPTGVTFDLRLSSQTVGGVTIKNVEVAGWIEGSEFDDTLIDGGGSPIFGMGGNDHLVAGYYTGNLYGGDGNDVVDGRNSQYLQRVDGGAGNDTLYTNSNTFAVADGGDGDDVIYAHGTINGGAGNDSVYVQQSYYPGPVHGDEGNDTIDASAASAATLYGDAGDDKLTGSGGNDILYGGAGNDTLTGGADNGDGESTGDKAVYTGNLTDYRVTEDINTHLVTITDLRDGSPDGTDTLDHTIELVQFSDEFLTLTDLVAGVGPVVDNFVGTAGNDTYAGNANNNTAVGNAGDDSLGGKGGNDTLEGDAGADTLSGGTGSDILYSDGPLGSYSVPYYNNTYITPQLDRGGEADVLAGGDGDDAISAGYGDSVDGGNGTDALFISFQGAPTGVTFDLGLSSQTVGGVTIKNVEVAGWIEGSEFDDTLIDGDGSPYGSFEPIFGMGGNDHLVAGYYTGNLYGGDGNDVVDGRNSQYLQRVDGGAGNDTLYTNSNTFAVADGGDGDDVIYAHGTINGGAGNDSIHVQQSYYPGPVHGDEGNDTIDASAASAATLYGDAGDDKLTGSGGSDILYGGDGSDRLTGGAGADTLVGGAGDDTYVLGSSADVIVETAGGGTDTVVAAISYTLGDNVENLLLSAVDVNGTGNELANRITGSVGNNLIDGRVGADVMIGNAGDDTYVVDDAGDIVVEYFFQGTDTVQSSVTYALTTNVENLVLMGSANINGTGNALNNTLIGNSGDNVLDGGVGADTMSGDLGNDTYYVGNSFDQVNEAAGGGTDTVYSGVTYTLSANVELLVLTGLGNNSATGNALDNSLTGNSGDNVLDGKAGADTMTGGLGNDTYVVDNAGDVIVEAAGEGIDGVTSSISFSLAGRFIENLTLSGSGNTAGVGNTFNNVLTGNAGSNSLDGGVGNDILDGKAGADTMTGGFGDDVFYVDNIADSVVEIAGQGNDAILASVTYSLTGSFVETLTLTGSGAVDATGNSQANVLNGNAGNNHLDGGYGHDILTGGLGADVFVFGTHSGTDTIMDFSAADNDTINVHAYLAHATAVISQSGADAVIDLGGGNVVTVLNTTATDAAFLSHIVW